MDTDYRLAAFATEQIKWRPRSIHRAQVLLLAALLAMAGGSSYAEGTAETEGEHLDALDPEAVEPLPIIVNLALDAGAGELATTPNAIAAISKRVLDRLQEVMLPAELAAVRTYENLPIIGLSADGDLLAFLLALPEVASIEHDREFTLQDAAPATF